MAASTRATRSRFSSPHQLPNGGGGGGGGGGGNSGPLEPSKNSANEGSKKLLEKWLEPNVQSRPSYEDHGLVRYGVVEGMAPLGELPKATMAKRRGQDGAPVRKIILKQSSLKASRDANATPASSQKSTRAAEPSSKASRSGSATAAASSSRPVSRGDDADSETSVPAKLATAKDGAASAVTPPLASPVEVHPSPSARQGQGQEQEQRSGPRPSGPTPAEKPARRPLPTGDSDDEFGHKAGASKSGVARTPLRRRSLPRISTGRRNSIITPRHLTESTPVTAPPSSSFFDTPLGEPTSEPAPDRDRIERIVNHAVDEALDHYRYPTAWALRTLYDENLSDSHFLAVLEAVFSQTASAEAVRWFANLVEARKREGKKDNKACYYFVPPTTNSRFTPHKAKTAPYGKLVTIDLSRLRQVSEATSHPPSEPQLEEQGLEQALEQAPEPAQAEAQEKEQEQEQKRDENQETGQEQQQKEEHQQVQRQQHSETAQTSARTRADAQSEKHVETPTPSRSSKKRHRTRRFPASPFAMNATTTGGGEAPPSTPSRKRLRRGSASSDSSALSELSGSPSLPSPTPAAKRDAPLAAGGRAAASSATPAEEVAPNNNDQQRPIRRTRASAAPQKDLSEPNSPSAATNPAADATMLGATASPLFPNLSSSKAAKGSKALQQQQKLYNEQLAAYADVDANAVWIKKRDAHAVTSSRTGCVESSVRQSAPPTTARDAVAAVASSASRADSDWEGQGGNDAAPATRTRRTRNSTANTRATRSGKRAFDELDNNSSPTASSFPGDAASMGTSRAVTPNLQPAAKKQRTSGLRVKSSPIKKKGGAAAGVPRPSGEGNVSSSFGGPTNSDDNDDYCSACGGVGDLVCCENCSRSFHFECVDLGLDEKLPEEWFCNVCLSGRVSAKPSETRGPFGGLMGELDKINPQAYKLPHLVQSFFEGVKAGAEGDYEDLVAASKPQRKRAGYDEAPDFFKVRDADGTPVLCHVCQGPAADNRAIIPCSVCGLYWHLDCLDPPMAIPPVVRTWRCPAHADELLGGLPESLTPAHRFRKIKDAPVIEQAYSRGMKNNGFIEIEDDDSDVDSGWKDVTSFGRVYKLPAKGIMLDFISQLRQQGAGHIHSGAATKHVDPTIGPQPALAPMDQRSMQEQQAALNLAGLATSESDGIGTLTQALLSQIDPGVLSLMARGDATNIASGNITNNDKDSLRAMLAQFEAASARIRTLLGSDGVPDSDASTTPVASHSRTPVANGLNSPPIQAKDPSDATAFVKNDSAETDLPTPATTAADNVEPANGNMEKSSPVHDSAMDLD